MTKYCLHPEGRRGVSLTQILCHCLGPSSVSTEVEGVIPGKPLIGNTGNTVGTASTGNTVSNDCNSNTVSTASNGSIVSNDLTGMLSVKPLPVILSE